MFGSSGGAVAGLAFAVRPRELRTLIAHEPPVPDLLPDAPHIRAVVDAVEDAYRQFGAGAAWPEVRVLRHSQRTGDRRRYASAGHRGRPRARVTLRTQTMTIGTGAAGTIGEAAGRRRTVLPAHAEAVHPLRPRRRRHSGRARQGGVVALGAASRGEMPLARPLLWPDRLGTSPTIFPGEPWWVHGRPGRLRRCDPPGAGQTARGNCARAPIGRDIGACQLTGEGGTVSQSLSGGESVLLGEGAEGVRQAVAGRE